MIFASVILSVLTSAAELSKSLQNGKIGESFDLTDVNVLSECKMPDSDFAVEDRTGAVILSPAPQIKCPHIRIGDRIHARGKITTTLFNHVYAACDQIDILKHLTPPAITTVTFQQILSGFCDAHTIRTIGTLRDYFTDEIDPAWIFIILNQKNETLYATCRLHAANELKLLDALIGSELALTGLCNPRPSGCRRKIGRTLDLVGFEAVEILSHPPADPFSAPEIGDISR